MISNEDKYSDIINLPHHQSKTKRPMPIGDRAAQFAPFSALTGYDDKVKETARITKDKIELDDYLIEDINNKLLFIEENIDNEPIIQITYFKKDEKKDGGAYITVSGRVKRLNLIKRRIIMQDKTEIPIDEIFSIEGELFNFIDYGL